MLQNKQPVEELLVWSACPFSNLLTQILHHKLCQFDEIISFQKWESLLFKVADCAFAE